MSKQWCRARGEGAKSQGLSGTLPLGLPGGLAVPSAVLGNEATTCVIACGLLPTAQNEPPSYHSGSSTPRYLN